MDLYSLLSSLGQILLVKLRVITFLIIFALTNPLVVISPMDDYVKY